MGLNSGFKGLILFLIKTEKTKKITCSNPVELLERVNDEAFMIYLLNAFGLTPGGSSTVHIYAQTVHRTSQCDRIPRTEHT